MGAAILRAKRRMRLLYSSISTGESTLLQYSSYCMESTVQSSVIVEMLLITVADCTSTKEVVSAAVVRVAGFSINSVRGTKSSLLDVLVAGAAAATLCCFSLSPL